MTYRARIKYTAAQKAEIWDRWQRGESMTSIGRVFDRPSSSIFNHFFNHYGFCALRAIARE